MSFPSRSRVTASTVLAAANCLTDRDRYLCSLLADHRVLTTDNVCDIGFGSVVTARHRLNRLTGLRVVDRFRPYRLGRSMPYHYVLDEIGALVVADERGVDLKALGWNPMQNAGLQASAKLDHLVGVNTFFSQLLSAGRESGASLLEWWSERRCAAEWGDFVVPDGFGTFRQGSVELQFFLEHDRGTETLERVVAKLARYEALFAAMGSHAPVLFRFAGSRREAGFRRLAGATSVAVVTSLSGAPPSSSCWLPLQGERRLDLRGLARWSAER